VLPKSTSSKQRGTRITQQAKLYHRAPSLLRSRTTTFISMQHQTSGQSTIRIWLDPIPTEEALSVSGLTKLPSDMFQGAPNKRLVKMGFEYWANPSNPDEGFVTWMVDDKLSVRMGAAAVGADQGTDGSGVGPRLIPEEPMSIVFNLGMSQNWQTIDLASMVFPSEMLVDYVRVYQRKGSSNVGCNPKDFPTTDYINNHLEAYQNTNVTWTWPKPRNSLYDGC